MASRRFGGIVCLLAAQSVLLLGLILEILPEQERAEFEAELPGPSNLVWALVGRRPYQPMMDRPRPAAAA